MFSTTNEKLLIQKMKEEMCYLASDFEEDSKGFQDQAEFKLPDGSSIRLSQNRIRCPQVLFEPGIYEAYDEYRGLHTIVSDCLKTCEMDMQKVIRHTQHTAHSFFSESFVICRIFSQTWFLWVVQPLSRISGRS